LKLTSEQNQIIESEKDNIFVVARAGTGKTTTLIEFTKRRPMEIFLYLAYNSSIKDEAAKKFFGNTDVHTIHSLAFKEIGKFFEHKLVDNLKIIDIVFGVSALKESYMKDKSNPEIYMEANRVLEILSSYFNSKYKKFEDIFEESESLSFAIEYFEKMQDLNNEDVKMTHDGYLKLFQLSEPTLNYDYVLVDEAQDSNEVMLDIVFNQETKKIFVGDNYQAIYGYRKVINIFENEDSDFFYLTKSFRFGESISFVINEFLTYYKRDFIKIEGLREQDMVCNLDYTVPYTFITRTNAYLFDLAYRAALSGKNIHIIGGEHFVFQELIDTMNLFLGKTYKIKSFYIREFKSFNNLKRIAENTNDQELLFLIKIVEKYKEKIEEAIELIKRKIVKERNAKIVFTTAHKAKGLEFYNVRLADDFIKLTDKYGNLIPVNKIDQEEVNIYYVAMSRAMENLELNSQLNTFLEKKYD